MNEFTPAWISTPEQLSRLEATFQGASLPAKLLGRYAMPEAPAHLRAGLWLIGGWLQPGPWKFFWLLPARNVAHGLWLASCALFRTRPLETTAILAVPLVTLVVTVVWVIGRFTR